ncbi:hypothetical protein LUZ61_001715 [Rhynchospora tenuis]|uniref:Uncharacterized protein n=1 Tax=Rhynchospora tenuis TaxID=198213 RepID=A0AAD5ZHM8_9POAL|nr:hypothetical protein LUZ61_001715 [Rhynchospora tenuis]
MKENDRESLRSSSPAVVGGGGDAAGLFGKGKYKAWALAAILLLAFWSMLTGTVTLNFSSRRHGLLLSPDDLVETPLREDLDVLEIEDREKLVRHMWDAYMHSERGPLPSFWQEAFQAAYEDLSGDDEQVRQAAISEIARMSLRMLNLDPPPLDNFKNGEHDNKRSNRNKARKSLAL